MVIDYSDRAFLTRLVRNKIPSVRKQIKVRIVVVIKYLNCLAYQHATSKSSLTYR